MSDVMLSTSGRALCRVGTITVAVGFLVIASATMLGPRALKHVEKEESLMATAMMRPMDGTVHRRLSHGNPSSIPPAPTAPTGSCWHFLPSGCPCGAGSTCFSDGGSAEEASGNWILDDWGPANGYTGVDGCSVRLGQTNGWCGVTDALRAGANDSIRRLCLTSVTFSLSAGWVILRIRSCAQH